MIRHTLLLLTILLFVSPFDATADTSALSIGQAFTHALDANLGLKATEARICALQGSVEQAGAMPNPSFELSLNDIGRGPGRHNDNDSNEIFLGVVQIIETAGKRPTRVRIAEAEQCIGDWEFEIKKNELYANMLHAFIDMAGAQEASAIAQLQHDTTKDLLKSVVAKVTSGKTSSIEEKKADIAFRSAKIAVARQNAQLKSAKQGIMALWHQRPLSFERVDYPLYETKALPPIEVLISTLDCHPNILKARAETAKAMDVVCLERSLRIPNVAVQVGVSTQQFTQEPALALGFEVPLPIFDRNKGNIQRATFEEAEAMYNQMDIESSMKIQLTQAYEDWKGAYDQARGLREDVLPEAEASMQLAWDGYNEGQFDYLHLLDATATLITVRQQYLDAIIDYHHKHAEVLRLTGACACNL